MTAVSGASPAPAPPIPGNPVSISVVICAYTAERWTDIVAAVRSVQAQTTPPSQVLLVVDHAPELLDRARATLSGVEVIANEEARGLSGARNTGVRRARGDVVAFLDDDAAAEPDWLRRTAAHYSAPDVLGTGGTAEAEFIAGRPGWLPPEFDWVVGCSYTGMPTAPTAVRNPIGANMSFRRELFAEVGDFTCGIGRVGRRPVGCEETEFAIRARQRHPRGRIVYDPAVRVRHTVPSTRTTWAYFGRRCFAEGLSKAAVTALVGPQDALESERRYVRRTLPLGVWAALRTVRSAGARAALARAAAIPAGLAVTAAGYAWGRLRRPARFPIGLSRAADSGGPVP